MKHSAAATTACYQIRFKALRPASQDVAFRCDDRGNVDLDSLCEKARIDYLFARALIGRNFARPAMVRTA